MVVTASAKETGYLPRRQVSLGQLLHVLGADQCQLALQLVDPRLEQAVRLAELAGHLVEQGKGLLQTGTTGLLERRRQAGLGGFGGTAVGFHLLLSHDAPSEDGQMQVFTEQRSNYIESLNQAIVDYKAMTSDQSS